MELFSQMYHKVFPSSINLPVPGIELQTSFMSLIFLVVINPSNKQISFLIYISFIYSNLLTHINLMFVSIHLKTDIIYMSFSSLQWNKRQQTLYSERVFLQGSWAENWSLLGILLYYVSVHYKTPSSSLWLYLRPEAERQRQAQAFRAASLTQASMESHENHLPSECICPMA